MAAPSTWSFRQEATAGRMGVNKVDVEALKLSAMYCRGWFSAKTLSYIIAHLNVSPINFHDDWVASLQLIVTLFIPQY